MKDYRNRYNDYWMESAQKTRTGKLAHPCNSNVSLTLSFIPGRPVEAIISPVTPYAAILPGKFQYSRKILAFPRLATEELTMTAYTSSLNVLDFPSVVIPVTFADKTIDKVSPRFTPLTEKDRINMALCMSFALSISRPPPVPCFLTQMQMTQRRTTAPPLRCRSLGADGTRRGCFPLHS